MTGKGAALYLEVALGFRTISHCVIWNNLSQAENGGSDIYVAPGGVSPKYRHCLIQGSYPAGIGNLDGKDQRNAPLFVVPTSPDMNDLTLVNLRMKPNSPTINQGDEFFLPKDLLDLNENSLTTEKIPVDFEGTPRILFSKPDLGAYESSSSVLHVNAAVLGGKRNGIGWKNAYTSLAHAIVDAQPQQQLWVAHGIYRPTEGNSSAINISDPTVSFNLKNELAIYGGFSGNELDFSQRNILNNISILSGDVDFNDEAPILTDYTQTVGINSYHVVRGDNTLRSAVLDGFVITAGKATTPIPGTLHNQAGGLLIENGNALIRNCRFTGNSALHGAGGGAHCRGGAKPLFINCLFTGNAALFGSAIIVSSQSNPTFTNCTITANTATSSTFYVAGAKAWISNTIIWNNTATNGSADTESIFLTSASCDINHSLIQHSNGSGQNWNTTMGTDGGENIDQPPHFVGFKDYRLNYTSPAIDVGNNIADLDGIGQGSDTMLSSTKKDAYSQSRIVSDASNSGTIDIGYFEYQSQRGSDTDADGMADYFEIQNSIPESSTSLLPSEDLDGDGRSNLEEYVFATNPRMLDHAFQSKLFQINGVGPDYYGVSYTYEQSSSKFVNMTIERSDNLKNWTEILNNPQKISLGKYLIFDDNNVNETSKGFIRFLIQSK